MRNLLVKAWLTRGWLACLLWPVAQVHLLLVRLRRALYRRGWLASERFSVPVIVVGNVVAGGAGKTPLVMALVKHLQAQGLQTASLITVNAVEPVQRLWACEQALHSPAVGAVLAWLPHAPVDALRRLQHAATRHGGLLWVFRPLQTQHQASPAPLRLRLDGWSEQGGLVVSVLKRRGPPVGHPVHLAPPGESLQAVLAAARWRQALRLRPVGVPQECHEPLAPAVVGPAELVA